MDGLNANAFGGSLHISTAAIAKIARMATLEVDGVTAVCAGTSSVKNFFSKVIQQQPVEVSLTEDVAQITIRLQVQFGSKIPLLTEKVQDSVKSAVQNMTGITVSKVNIIVTSVAVDSVDTKVLDENVQ